MRLRAASLLALLAAGCSRPPSVHLASEAETRAVLNNTTERFRSPKSPVCLSRKIAPALEGTKRSYDAIRVTRPWWKIPLRWFDLGPSAEAAAEWKITNPKGEFVSIHSDERLDLERKLGTALHFHAKAAPQLNAERVFPSDLLEPAEAKEDVPCGGAKEIEESFSQPIIVGDTAFVESNGFCGGLCGSGHLQAYRYSAGKWQPVASKLLWIA
jgi:hypothetical protein